jgi:hypothetical protein
MISANIHLDQFLNWHNRSGYTIWWTREGVTGGTARSARVPAGTSTGGYSRALRGLACGARHKVWLRAHSLAGVSAPSPALLAATTGRRE